MGYAQPEALVSTEWLAAHMSAPDVRVVDATSFLPNDERDPRTEYEDCHIPGSVFFDINDICEEESDLPHMLPTPEKFSSRVRSLGLGNGNRIIVYDRMGGALAAARVWWMFRLFGHTDVALLNGGLGKWMEDGHPTNDDIPAPRERHFIAKSDHTMVRRIDHVLENLQSLKEQVIDARGAERFDGIQSEPRPSKRKGHIPGSLNVPFTKLLNTENNFVFLDQEEIIGAFEDAGVELGKRTITTCGSGVTAALLTFGFYLTGHNESAVYDGSWAEWGNRGDTPIET